MRVYDSLQPNQPATTEAHQPSVLRAMRDQIEANGACAGTDDSFVAPEGKLPIAVQRDLIATYCEPCVVSETCGEYAILTGQRGVWGGMTDLQLRRRIEERKAAQADGHAVA